MRRAPHGIVKREALDGITDRPPSRAIVLTPDEDIPEVTAPKGGLGGQPKSEASVVLSCLLEGVTGAAILAALTAFVMYPPSGMIQRFAAVVVSALVMLVVAAVIAAVNWVKGRNPPPISLPDESLPPSSAALAPALTAVAGVVFYIILVFGGMALLLR